MKNERSLAYLALIFICIVWGSTYLAVHVAAIQFGPFRLAVFRQLTASALLFLWVFGVKKMPFPTRKHVLQQAMVGFMTIGCWNGLVNWALLHLPIGLVSILASIVPALIAILSQFWLKTERLIARQWLGVLLGFIGLGLIFSDGWHEFLEPNYQLGVILTLLATVVWAFGTVFAKKFSTEKSSPILDSGIQLGTGGLFMFLVSLFFDFFKPLEVDVYGWISLVFVIIFGSVIAMTAYLYALKNLPATIASLYTYVNPVIALILGVLFLNEKLDWLIGIGMMITLIGVFMVNSKKTA